MAEACGQTMVEEIEYKNHRVVRKPHGLGWRALIYPPGSTLSRADVIRDPSPAGRHAVLAEAKRVIDQLSPPRPLAGKAVPAGESAEHRA